jgi:hypothetical protein
MKGFNFIVNYFYKIRWKSLILGALLLSFFYLVGLFIPEGFDWKNFFSQDKISPIWTPWTTIVIRFIDLPLLMALTLFGIVLRTYRNSKAPIYSALAIISLPTLWVLFLGNLDGLVMIGLLLLPWGIPLVMMKPQLAGFALLAKKSSIYAAIAWGLFSIIIWGFWPVRFLSVLTPAWSAEWQQDISLFPWGLIIAIPLLWLSQGDEDMLMAAGSFATPHLFPYHFILLMPSLSRMSWGWTIICWLLSWTPLLANWFGSTAWHMGNLFALCTWFGLYLSIKRKSLNPSLALEDFADSSNLA